MLSNTPNIVTPMFIEFIEFILILKIDVFIFRYVEEWLMCMASKGIVQYENSQFTIMNSVRIRKAIHTSLALPMFADCFPKLENAMKNKDINTGLTFQNFKLCWLLVHI